MDIARQHAVIESTAIEVLSLQEKIIEAQQRIDALNEELSQSQHLLLDLICAMQESAPDKSLPERFTVNGILIDISGNNSCPTVSKVPELTAPKKLPPTS